MSFNKTNSLFVQLQDFDKRKTRRSFSNEQRGIKENIYIKMRPSSLYFDLSLAVL